MGIMYIVGGREGGRRLRRRNGKEAVFDSQSLCISIAAAAAAAMINDDDRERTERKKN